MKNITKLISKKTASILCALIVVGFVQSIQAACTPPPSGLVGWWQGEENASDFTGINNGTVLVATNYQPGAVGQGFGMNGVSGAVRIPASPSLNVGQAGGLTLETWIYPSNTDVHTIIEWSLDANPSSYETGLETGHPFYPACNLYGFLTETNNTTIHELFSFGPLASGTFEHVAMTYDKASGIGRLFINGQMVTETNLGTFTPKTMDTLYLGKRPPGDPYSNVLVGRIDEASVYNRALTTNEIAAIYNAGNAGKCTGTLVAPIITRQPTNLTVTLNDVATLSVTALGTAPLSYQWKLNSTNLPAQTNTSLTLLGAQLSQTGNYSVLVSNSVSTVTSSNALLTVIALPCASASSGLVSWWPGEGNATDIIGTNNGTVQGASNYLLGRVGQGFDMNGVSGAVRIPASPSLNVGLSGGMTVEAWIYPSNTAVHSIFEWTLDANPGNYESGLDTGHPFYSACNLYGYFVDTNNTIHELFSFGPRASGSFEHVAMTYDKGSGIGRLFINGLMVTETNLGNFTAKTMDNLYLGKRPPGDPYSNVFAGRIDEASVYKRALTTNEIAAIYNAAGTGKCVPPPNHPPVAGGTFTLGVKIGAPSTVKIIGGKYPPTDVDNDVMTITGVTGAANGITSTDGTNVTYTATNGTTDSFNCTIDDGRGGTAIQTVNVAITANGGLGFNQLSPQSLGGGTNVLTFLGTPGFNYALERATNLVPPVLWRPQVTNVAKPNGFLIFTNVTSNSPVFYRTRYVP